MSTAYDIIIRPVLTEKTTALMESDDKVVFRVARTATKPQIRAAVEQLFGVKVSKVNTMIMPSKPKRVGFNWGRRSAFKKAVVTLAEGEHFDLFALEGDEEEDNGLV